MIASASTENPLVNLQAERAVLGAILIDPGAADACIEALSEVPGFYLREHRELFEAMIELRQDRQPIDAVTLQDALKRRGTIEVAGGATAIGGLMREVHTSANVQQYIGIVIDRARARSVFEVARKLQALDPVQSAEDLVAQAHEIAERIGDDGADAFEIKPITKAEIEKYISAAPTTGMAIHWEPMRKAFGRLDADGELVVIGARPSVGKTALAISWATEEMRGGTKVGFVSLEKRRRQVLMRMAARMARIDLAKLTHGRDQAGRVLTSAELRALDATAQQMAALPFMLLNAEDVGTPTPQRVVRACAFLARRGASLIFLDQLYRVVFPETQRGMRFGQVIGAFARRLQMEVAWKQKTCVAVLHQLNRESEKTDEPPRLSALRESGELEQDADRVLFLHRPPEADQTAHTNAEFIVAKSSDGWRGTFKAFFAAACGAYFGSKADEGTTFYGVAPEGDDHWSNQTEAF
mgnify:CR=1 FL=1